MQKLEKENNSTQIVPNSVPFEIIYLARRRRKRRERRISFLRSRASCSMDTEPILFVKTFVRTVVFPVMSQASSTFHLTRPIGQQQPGRSSNGILLVFKLRASFATRVCRIVLCTILPEFLNRYKRILYNMKRERFFSTHPSLL